MPEVLIGLDCVVYTMDNILVHGKAQEEHDETLRKVLQWLQETWVTLNAEKSQSCKQVSHSLGTQSIALEFDWIQTN